MMYKQYILRTIYRGIRTVRERAIRRVREVQHDHSSQRAVIVSISSKIGCTHETLRRWVRQGEKDHCE